MSPEPEFDEKEFWIALFSIVVRREEMRQRAAAAPLRMTDDKLQITNGATEQPNAP